MTLFGPRPFALISLIVLFVFSIGARASTEVRFSPHGGCEDEVVSLIEKSKQQIDVAIYSFNDRAIIKALSDAKDRGVKIRIVIDHSQASTNRAATFDLEKKKFNFRLHSVGKIMHDKVGIFDHKRVMTGSFNWTEAAENKNEENCLMIDEISVVKEYDARFENRIWPKNTQEKSDHYMSRFNHKLTEAQQSQLERE
jgi:phosphatidylserine/phosphatidylglycerophosphate/cardiolipin synthase-like enzyme